MEKVCRPESLLAEEAAEGIVVQSAGKSLLLIC